MVTTSFASGSAVDAAKVVSQMNTAFARQAQEYLNLCANSLTFCTEMAESWRNCLQASSTASEQALQKLNGSRNVEDWIGAYNEWVRRSSHVFGEEAGKVPQRATAFGEKVMNTVEEMSRTVAKMAPVASFPPVVAWNGNPEMGRPSAE